MWDLIVSVPDHCLSFYFSYGASMELGNESLFKRSRSYDQDGRHPISGKNLKKSPSPEPTDR